jgi:hypothetical protein
MNITGKFEKLEVEVYESQVSYQLNSDKQLILPNAPTP